MRQRRFLWLVVLIVAACGACDRRAPVAPATAPSSVIALQLELKPVTPLLPARPTHAALDRLGNVYWVQETDRADDTLFVIGEGDIPRATTLSAASISESLGAPGGRGNIQGIAAGQGGEIYFFFAGVQGRRPLACVGQFTPKTGQTRILADSDALATATGMGRSLPLARGDVIGDFRSVWIWVRHTDAWAIFRFDPRGLSGAGANAPFKLSKQFDAVRLKDEPIDLTREEYRLAPAADDDLFLLDPLAGRLLRIGRDGNATMVRSLIGLPRDLSTPTLDRNGRLILFAGNSDPIPGSPSVAPDIAYPAMLVFDGDQLTTINRDSIVAYPGFPTVNMRFDTIVPHPADASWISYDAGVHGSGELLRLKIVDKSF